MIFQNMPKTLSTQGWITIIISAIALIFAIVVAVIMPVPWYLTVIQVCMSISCWPPAYLAFKASQNDSRENLTRYASWSLASSWGWFALGIVSIMILVFSFTFSDSGASTNFIFLLMFWSLINMAGNACFFRFSRLMRLYLGQAAFQQFDGPSENYGIGIGGNNYQGGNSYVPQGGNMYVPQSGNAFVPQGGNAYYGGATPNSSPFSNPPNAQPYGNAPAYYVPGGNNGGYAPVQGNPY